MAYYENLAQAKQALQQKVQSGEMQQWQAEQELKSIRAHNTQKSKQNLDWQVQQGWIGKDQASQALDQLSQLDDEKFAQATATDPSAGGQDTIGSYTNKNPQGWTTDPNSGSPRAPITGAHTADWGAPVTPAADVSSADSTIYTQDAYNRYGLEQDMLVNRPNETNDYGSLEYVRDPVTGQMTRKTSLSDPQKQMLGQQQGRDIGLGDMAQGSINQFGRKGDFSYADAPQIVGSNDLMGERKRQEDLYYQNWQGRNESSFAQEQEALKQSLADRGIPLTSERAQAELKQIDQRQNDARLNAQTTAVDKSRAEYQTNFDTQLQNRQQYIDEYGQVRYAPLNEASTMLGMQKGIQDPNVTPMSQLDVQTVDAAGIGSTYRGQDYNKMIEEAKRSNEKWLGELDSDTRIDVAKIGAEASKYNANKGFEASKLATDERNRQEKDNEIDPNEEYDTDKNGIVTGEERLANGESERRIGTLNPYTPRTSNSTYTGQEYNRGIEDAGRTQQGYNNLMAQAGNNPEMQQQLQANYQPLNTAELKRKQLSQIGAQTSNIGKTGTGYFGV